MWPGHALPSPTAPHTHYTDVVTWARATAGSLPVYLLGCDIHISFNCTAMTCFWGGLRTSKWATAVCPDLCRLTFSAVLLGRGIREVLSAHLSLALGTHCFLRRNRCGTEKLAICCQLGVHARFTFIPESLVGGQLWHMDEAHMRLDPASVCPGRLRGTWFPYKGSYAYDVSIVGFVSF